MNDINSIFLTVKTLQRDLRGSSNLNIRDTMNLLTVNLLRGGISASTCPELMVNNWSPNFMFLVNNARKNFFIYRT